MHILLHQIHDINDYHSGDIMTTNTYLQMTVENYRKKSQREFMGVLFEVLCLRCELVTLGNSLVTIEKTCYTD